jgi:peptidylprolyl isomerase
MPVVVTPDPSTPAGQAPSAGRGYALFCPGTTAFAHGTQPDSANSQIFLMRGIGGPTLEKKYTAFGRILEGQAAVEAIRNGEPPANPDRITRMRVVADLPAAERPKLQVMDTKSAAFVAEVHAAMQAKGPAFSACDMPVPVRPTP